ncbi:hypothetical protein GQ53DRAFT_803391 [Thozetella sp. PMI_491]|nr:hypothetical protein GQ53DRAFT_803391 [Thozetella sp. PMI_491]
MFSQLHNIPTTQTAPTLVADYATKENYYGALRTSDRGDGDCIVLTETFGPVGDIGDATIFPTLVPPRHQDVPGVWDPVPARFTTEERVSLVLPPQSESHKIMNFRGPRLSLIVVPWSLGHDGAESGVLVLVADDVREVVDEMLLEPDVDLDVAVRGAKLTCVDAFCVIDIESDA